MMRRFDNMIGNANLAGDAHLVEPPGVTPGIHTISTFVLFSLIHRTLFTYHTPSVQYSLYLQQLPRDFVNKKILFPLYSPNQRLICVQIQLVFFYFSNFLIFFLIFLFSFVFVFMVFFVFVFTKFDNSHVLSVYVYETQKKFGLLSQWFTKY